MSTWLLVSNALSFFVGYGIGAIMWKRKMLGKHKVVGDGKRFPRIDRDTASEAVIALLLIVSLVTAVWIYNSNKNQEQCNADVQTRIAELSRYNERYDMSLHRLVTGFASLSAVPPEEQDGEQMRVNRDRIFAEYTTAYEDLQTQRRERPIPEATCG